MFTRGAEPDLPEKSDELIQVGCKEAFFSTFARYESEQKLFLRMGCILYLLYVLKVMYMDKCSNEYYF